MKYIQYTHVDEITRKSVFDAVAVNGSSPPGISGLSYEFGLESRFPTATPVYYGSCPDDSDVEIDGILAVITKDEFDATYAQELEDRVDAVRGLINQERDRRIDAGVMFKSKLFQTKQADRENISARFAEAALAVMQGKQPGDYFWRDPVKPHGWLAADNTGVGMDAHEMIEFGHAASTHKELHIHAARALKDLTPIPDDYQDDKHWP